MNYCKISYKDVTEVECVGIGTGEIEGQPRVCLGFEGKNINISEEEKTLGWISMTEECSKHLYLLLHDRHGGK